MSIVPTANPNQQLQQSQQQSQQQQQITTSNNNNTNTINTSSSSTSSSNLSQRNSSENNNTSTTTITSSNQQSQQQQPSLPTNLSVSALSNMATKPVSQRTNTNNTSQILSIASMIPAATTASKSQQQSTSNLTNNTTNNTTTNIANNNNSVTSNGTNITSQMSQAQVGSSTPNITTLPPQIPQQQQIQPVYDDINIFMWSVCKICNKSTRKMAMSPDTWSFSLAKFLELTFHAHNYHQYNGPDEGAVCKHALFQDHYQYFRFKNVVTVFSTSKIIIKSLQIPELVLKSTVFDY